MLSYPPRTRAAAVWWRFIGALTLMQPEPRKALRRITVVAAIFFAACFAGVFLPRFERSILYAALLVCMLAAVAPNMAATYMLFHFNPPDPRPFLVRATPAVVIICMAIAMNLWIAFS